MDIANLRAFAAVARCRSFSQAGETLHLSQPAISKRIAVLEAQLATALFDRVGKSVELTAAGRALLSRVGDIEQSLQRAEDAVRSANNRVAGTLRIATSHHIGLHRLPPILSSYQRRYPEVQLDIEFLDSEQAYARLRSGAIELAVVTLAPGDVSELHSEAVWHDPLSVMMVNDHPLTREERVDLPMLARYPAVLPGIDTFTGQIVHRHFQNCGENLDLRLATNYLETLRMMAIVGLGWTVLPDTMSTPELTRVRVRGTTLARTLGLLRHGERSLSNSAAAFQEVLLRNRNQPSP